MSNQAEANLAALIESTEDLIWSVDLDYRLITFNRALRENIKETLGVQLAPGMRLHELLPPERAALWPPFYERVLHEGPFRIEYSLILPRTLELAFNPILVDGHLTGISVFGKDITERKAAEKALREAEKKYQDIFEGALEGFYQTTPEGEFLAANPALAKMLGYDSPEQLISMATDLALDVWVYPEERARYLQQLEEDGVVRDFECQFKRQDGAPIWVSLNTRRVCGTDGRALYFEGFIEDITERKRAEKQIRESKERYRTVFQTSPDAIVISRLSDGVIIDANQTLLDSAGYEYNEFVGHTTQELGFWVNPGDKQKLVDKLLQHIECRDFEVQSRRRNGEIFWVRLNASLIEVGGIPCLLMFAQDISQAKEAKERLAAAQEALRQSEERYRSVFQTSIDAIAITRLEDGTIIDVNQACCRMHGFERDEMIGRTSFELHLWTNPKDRQRLIEALRENSCRDMEFLHTRKDGKNYWVLISGARIELDGVPCVLLVTRDISEIKAAAEALRQSEERYRTAFQTSLDAIIITRLDDGMFVDVNEALLTNTGYAREEVVGHTVWEVNIWANPDDRKKMLESLRQNSKCRNLEARFRKKDGTFLWGLLLASVIELDGVPCVLSVVRDISEGKAAAERLARAAEALRVSEERYRTIFQTSIDSISINRLADGMFVDVNQACCRMHGYERDEMIGRTSSELHIWVDPQDRQRMVEALRENSFCRDMEFLHAKRNGEKCWVLVSGALMELDGVPCILLVVRDNSETKAAAEALRASEERYRTVFQTSLDAISINRVSDEKYIDCNQAFLDNLGFEREEVLGRTSQELNIWADGRDLQKLVEILRQNYSCRGLEAQFRKKNGEVRWGEISAEVIQLDGVYCIISITRDTSAAKAAEERLAAAQEALRASEERYRTVFQTSPDLVDINRLDDGTFIDANDAYLDILGFEREEVIGRTSWELNIWADPRDRQNFVELLRQNSNCRNLEANLRRKNGEIVSALISAAVIELDGVPCIISITRDMSAAKEAENTIHNLAFYDPLTGLPNRRLLLDRLRQALAASARWGRSQALLLIDLDNLKTLNETLGHQTGDYLLQEFARRLAACVRGTDTVARLGGDEFVVMLDDLSEVAEEAAAQAQAVSEKILASVGQPYLFNDRECLSSASIGITIFGDRQNSTDDILQQADIALHQAKAAGRNTMRFFSPALQAAVNARATLEEDLRRAIKANQFLLYYQPQVEQGRLTGAEALIRWKHPLRGIVPPDEFIPLAEETGLILPLGEWVLNNACMQIASWAGHEQTADFTVAVNISARQLRQPEFVGQVLAALDRTGANPGRLRLELTESMLVENIEEIIAKMTQLKSHGLRFSLDDFGTGYSSLAYLKRLPLDRLKVDRAFVRDILVDASSGAIAQTILSLGRAMGLSVIAEGVETEEQLTFLVGLGCHSFQGYLFSRPLPLKEFHAFLQSFKADAAPLRP